MEVRQPYDYLNLKSFLDYLSKVSKEGKISISVTLSFFLQKLKLSNFDKTLDKELTNIKVNTGVIEDIRIQDNVRVFGWVLDKYFPKPEDLENIEKFSEPRIEFRKAEIYINYLNNEYHIEITPCWVNLRVPNNKLLSELIPLFENIPLNVYHE